MSSEWKTKFEGVKKRSKELEVKVDNLSQLEFQNLKLKNDLEHQNVLSKELEKNLTQCAGDKEIFKRGLETVSGVPLSNEEFKLDDVVQLVISAVKKPFY